MKSDELKQNNVNPQELEEKIQQLEEQIAQHEKDTKESELRHAADLTNARQRFAQQLSQTEKYSSEKFASDLLAVLDALIIAQKTLSENPESEIAKGIDMALQIFFKSLAKNGITPIATDQEFNPELHIAVTMQKSKKHKKNHIVEVLQDGYMIHDRVLRPATVIVAS